MPAHFKVGGEGMPQELIKKAYEFLSQFKRYNALAIKDIDDHSALEKIIDSYSSFVICEWFYLICIGLVSLIAQVFLTKAFTHENAAVVEIVRYIGIAFNAFWGFMFWAEIPDVFSLIGMAMIIGGCILITRIKGVKKHIDKDTSRQKDTENCEKLNI
jgi:multidrug transporter EmrE-like cation transporter